MIKKRGKTLSMDIIIESCLILMVLLLLSCARHLIVECTALITHRSCHHFLQRPPGGACVCQTVLPPPLPLLSCLPSVIQSVTSPVIHPCVCKSWLCVLKQPGGGLLLVSFPPSQKGKKEIVEVENWEWRIPGDLPLGASRPSVCTCASPSHELHPSVHPSIRSRGAAVTGTITLDYLKKRRSWGEPPCSAAGAPGSRRRGGSGRDFTVKLKLDGGWASRRSPPLPHTHTHTR